MEIRYSSARLKSLIFRVARGLEKLLMAIITCETAESELGRVSAPSGTLDNEEGTEEMPREKTRSRRRHYP